MDPSTTQEVQFIFRRLADALHIAGKEIDGRVWLAVLVPVLLAAVFYVGWMYIRDGRAVGKIWAAFLGTLRCTVYFVLALVFLLPAEQTWETTKSSSKVVLLMDV